MGLRDFGGDIEAEPKPLLAGPHGAQEEWLKQAFHCGRRDRFATIRYGQLVRASGRRGSDPDGHVRCPVGDGIAPQIRKQLRNPCPIAIDGLVKSEGGFDGAVWVGAAQFFDDLVQGWLD